MSSKRPRSIHTAMQEPQQQQHGSSKRWFLLPFLLLSLATQTDAYVALPHNHARLFNSPTAATIRKPNWNASTCKKQQQQKQHVLSLKSSRESSERSVALLAATSSPSAPPPPTLNQVWSDWAASAWTKCIGTDSNDNDNAYCHSPQTQKRLADYERAKQEWADRYTHVEALRQTFGRNRNSWWGDLDAGTTRRLYKTLLPTALLELVQLGVQPQDLAPLAYRARVAAKLYARERAQLPYRILSNLLDGYRTLKTTGRFQRQGLSYPQLWEKYRLLIEDEIEAGEHELTEQDVTAKICLKILEKSCETNPRIDGWFLNNNNNSNGAGNKLPLSSNNHKRNNNNNHRSSKVNKNNDLQVIRDQLEQDVRKLLLPVAPPKETPRNLTLQKYRTWRIIAEARRKARRRSLLTSTQQQQHRPRRQE